MFKPRYFNYGVHGLCFIDNNNNYYYFSCNELIAFIINGEFHIIKNYWGTTTGKHLNWIDSDKSIREDQKTFLENLERLEQKNQ